jgi:hypothetical protein
MTCPCRVRIDDAADILHDQVVQKIDAADAGIDPDVRCCSAVSRGMSVVVGEGVIGAKPVLAQLGELH